MNITMMNGRERPQRSWRPGCGSIARGITAWIVALTISLFSVVIPCVTVADQSLPIAAVAYRDGKITGIYETTFQIDHKTYSLVPDVVILDRHGDPLNAGDIRVDIEVKYHLLKGTTDKIDQIILYLPF